MNVTLFGECYDISAATATGKRKENQDCFGWVALSGGTIIGQSTEGPIGPIENGGNDCLIAVVCDGMGGMKDGAAASRTMIHEIVKWASNVNVDSANTAFSSLVTAISDAEDMIIKDYPGSGTTISLVIVIDGEWTSYHVGDSRCYTLTDGEVWRTEDQSPVEAMFRMGMIDEDEMNDHPMSNLLSKYIGGGNSEDAIIERVPSGWSKLAICSDGAFGYMPPSKFRDTMNEATDAESIVRTSLEMESKDNVTAILISRIDDPGLAEGPQ